MVQQMEQMRGCEASDTTSKVLERAILVLVCTPDFF